MTIPHSNNNSSSIHWLSLVQFGLSGLAVLFVWGIAMTMVAAGSYQFFQGVSIRNIEPTGFLMGAGFFLIGTLLFPSAWFALMRMMNRPVSIPRWATWKNAGKAIWVMPVVVLVGYGVAITPQITWLFLPPLNILALSIPVVWYLSLGGRGLESSSPQSAWGAFGAGLALGPFFILFIELIAGVLLILVFVAWFSQEPGFVREIEQLALRLQFSSSPAPSDFLPLVEKYFMRPSVLVGGLLYIAVFVPLLEEFFKPIGLIFMNKQTLTPARGFLAGMLSGAAFGLFENLLQAVSGPEWIILAVGRTGTSLIHIFNSGLVGWGFALAWQNRRPMAWVGRYGLAVLIHAIWNGMTVMVGVSTVPEIDFVSGGWMVVGMGVLVVLAGICFVALIRLNQNLRRDKDGSRLETGISPGSPALSLPEPEGAPLVENVPHSASGE